MLDLRNVHHHFWDVSAGPEDGDGSAETVCQKQKATRPHSYALRRRLKVVTDLCLQFDLEEHQTYFLQWAQERRGSLNLCCVKMQIRELPLHTVRKILQIFQPYCIEELELNTGWTLSTLACFTPCLGQMKNLRKLHLTLVHEKLFTFLRTSTDIQEKSVTKFISQFSKLNSLQHLDLTGLYFLTGHMNELLG